MVKQMENIHFIHLHTLVINIVKNMIMKTNV